MDKCGFDLSATCRRRQVALPNAPIRSETALSTSVHKTIIANISNQDAPVPTLLIYPSRYLITESGEDLSPRSKPRTDGRGDREGDGIQQLLHDNPVVDRVF